MKTYDVKVVYVDKYGVPITLKITLNAKDISDAEEALEGILLAEYEIRSTEFLDENYQ
jgi:hypothetical protein